MLITKETYWSHIQHTLASITRAALTAVFAKYIIVWLDLSNVYSSIPHQLITFTFNFYHIPSRIRSLVANYFNKLLCLLHNSGDLKRLASDEELQLSHPVHSSIHDHDSNWWSEESWEIPVNSATPGPTGVGLPGWCHHPPLDSSLHHQTPEKAWGTANIGPGENKTSKVTLSLKPGRSQERQHLLLSPQWEYEWSLRLPEGEWNTRDRQKWSWSSHKRSPQPHSSQIWCSGPPLLGRTLWLNRLLHGEREWRLPWGRKKE